MVQAASLRSSRLLHFPSPSAPPRNESLLRALRKLRAFAFTQFNRHHSRRGPETAIPITPNTPKPLRTSPGQPCAPAAESHVLYEPPHLLVTTTATENALLFPLSKPHTVRKKMCVTRNIPIQEPPKNHTLLSTATAAAAAIHSMSSHLTTPFAGPHSFSPRSAARSPSPAANPKSPRNPASPRR